MLQGAPCCTALVHKPSLGGLCGPKARQCQLPHFNLSFFFLPLVPPHQAPGGGGHLLLKENDFLMGNGLDTKKTTLPHSGYGNVVVSIRQFEGTFQLPVFHFYFLRSIIFIAHVLQALFLLTSPPPHQHTPRTAPRDCVPSPVPCWRRPALW